MVVNVGFVVFFFHIEIVTDSLFDKVRNVFLAVHHDLGQIESNSGQHRFQLFNYFLLSEALVDLYFEIGNFGTLCGFLNPEIATSFGDVCEPHVDWMA